MKDGIVGMLVMVPLGLEGLEIVTGVVNAMEVHAGVACGMRLQDIGCLIVNQLVVDFFTMHVLEG